MDRWIRFTLVVAAALAGCGDGSAEPGGGDTLGAASLAPSYADWKSSLFHEPGTDGAYIVDYDIAIGTESALRAYYETHVRSASRELVVDVAHGEDVVWSATEKRALRYCVSPRFGDKRAAVVAAMRSAAASWEAAADVELTHASAEDARCRTTNDAVVFDVRPISSAPYLARSFFPNQRRRERSIVVAASALRLKPPLTLTGILRHELGHVLGLRHEHTRPEAHACYEDSNWRPLTPYDPASVMHYPQCNGTGDWGLTLTSHDQEGIAALYGPPRA